MMDARAEHNLHEKLVRLINASEEDPNGIFGADWLSESLSVAQIIVKQKGDWISFDGAVQLINENIIFGDIRFFEGAKVLSVEERAGQILSYVRGIPYSYDVYFDFNTLLDGGDKFSLEVDGLFKFGSFESEDVRGPEGTVLTRGVPSRPITCLHIKCVGFLDSSESCITANDSLSIFKSFVMLATYENLLTVSHWGAPKVNRYLNHPAMYYKDEQELLPGGSRKTRTLSRDINTLLHRLRPVRIEGLEAIEGKLKSLSDNFQELLTHSSKASKKISVACEWAFDALVDESSAMSTVKVCTALEAMYGDHSPEVGVTKTLADRCGFFLGESHHEREKICKDVYSLYKLRSKIVHGVINRLNSEDQKLLDYGKHLLKRSVLKELAFLRFG